MMYRLQWPKTSGRWPKLGKKTTEAQDHTSEITKKNRDSIRLGGRGAEEGGGGLTHTSRFTAALPPLVARHCHVALTSFGTTKMSQSLHQTSL